MMGNSISFCESSVSKVFTDDIRFSSEREFPIGKDECKYAISLFPMLTTFLTATLVIPDNWKVLHVVDADYAKCIINMEYYAIYDLTNHIRFFVVCEDENEYRLFIPVTSKHVIHHMDSLLANHQKRYIVTMAMTWKHLVSESLGNVSMFPTRIAKSYEEAEYMVRSALKSFVYGDNAIEIIPPIAQLGSIQINGYYISVITFEPHNSTTVGLFKGDI